MFAWLQLAWTTPSGIRLRVASYNEWIIYNEVFVDGEYDAAIEAAIGAWPRDRTLRVLDLGANVGFFTLRLFDRLRAAGLTDSSCAATLVEANPDLIPELRARLHDSNGLAASVRIVHGLAGQPTGNATLFRSPDAHGDSSILRPTADGVSVPYIDLRPLVSDAPVLDLLKCDIEGAELALLERYPELLERTRVAIVEHHHDLAPVDRCRERLRTAGLVDETVLRDRGGCSLRLYSRAGSF
jgi:FkbM family methyltransferase